MRTRLDDGLYWGPSALFAMAHFFLLDILARQFEKASREVMSSIPTRVNFGPSALFATAHFFLFDVLARQVDKTSREVMSSIPTTVNFADIYFKLHI